MKSVYFVLFLLFSIVSAMAQCVSGDCINGKGKMDYGYAIYSGEFKSGRAHGYGIMDYGGGDKYEGHFMNGKEEGEGLLFKKGHSVAVIYRNGFMQEKKERVVLGAGDALKTDINCSGDCENGIGSIKFPSGNVYTGSFKDGKFHGRGKMTFASGNILEGEFVNHFPARGSFIYASDGTTFNGTFNRDGTPQSGTYKSKETGGVVQIASGEITQVSNPRLDSMRASQPKYESKKCELCSGKGFSVMTSTKYEQLTPNVYQASSTGFASLVSAGQSLKTTHSSQLKCRLCAGSGMVNKASANK